MLNIQCLPKVPPGLAQLEERWTVTVVQISTGRWFDSSN